MAELTDRGRKVLKALRECALEGRSPSVRELCKKTGIPSASTVWKELRALEEAGMIQVDRGSARGITLTNADGTVASAVPVITFLDPITNETRPKVPEEMVPFLLPERAVGISYAVKVMCETGDLKQGDMAVFCRADTTVSGTPAVLLFNGTLTVGMVEERADGSYAAINDRMYKLGAEADIAVVGRILGVVRRFF